VARKAGYVQIANVFEETANHEKEHAKQWAKLLGLVGTLEEDLKAAIAGEAFENSEMYPRMAAEAKEEGHAEIAKLFEAVGDAEKMHEARYKALLKNVEEGTAFKRGEEKTWKCGNCGYLHKGDEAPEACPACAHAQKHFELFSENY
jgi:rubrerythrin